MSATASAPECASTAMARLSASLRSGVPGPAWGARSPLRTQIVRNETAHSAHATSRIVQVSQSMTMPGTLTTTTDIVRPPAGRNASSGSGTGTGTGLSVGTVPRCTPCRGVVPAMSVGPPSVSAVPENALLPTRPGGRLDLLDRTRSDHGTPRQLGLDEVGQPLAETTFVVVDLETTGGSPASCAITEIGAVKVRGGEVLGEFQTLVDPGTSVPPMITVLTGITDAMLVGAPRIGEVLPSFLEFSRGAVLVAHNAAFDVGFLRAAATRLDLPWPRPVVVDTVALARRVVTRDEAPNNKLSSLAALFRATTTPRDQAARTSTGDSCRQAGFPARA